MEQARCRNHARAAAAGAAATCSQHDLEEWLASGPSTRLRIRSFLGWAKRSGLIRFAVPCYQQQLPASALTQEQRLAWLKELLKALTVGQLRANAVLK